MLLSSHETCIPNICQVLYVTDTRVKGSPAMTFTQGHGLDGPWGMVAGKKLCI